MCLVSFETIYPEAARRLTEMGKFGIKGLITGPREKFKKSTFQGHVGIVESVKEVEALISKMKDTYFFQEATQMPYAYRISVTNAPDGLLEHSMDGKEVGAGDKLLHLLQRWETQNVVLFVTRHDRSLCGELVGIFKYRYILDCAKRVLEECYLQQLQPGEDEQPEEPEEKVVNTGICMLSPETVNFPANHIPTSDGSGRAGVKQGRINHFNSKPEKVIPVEPDVLAIDKPPSPVKLPDVNESPAELTQLNITRKDLESLKAFRKPPKELHLVLVCIGLLLKVKDLTWDGCRQMITSMTFCTRLVSIEPKQLSKKQIDAVRTVLQTPGFTPEDIRCKTLSGANLLAYVQQVVEHYDLMYLGIEPTVLLPKVVSQHRLVPSIPLTSAPAAPPPLRSKYNSTSQYTEPNQEKVQEIIDRGRMLKF